MEEDDDVLKTESDVNVFSDEEIKEYSFDKESNKSNKIVLEIQKIPVIKKDNSIDKKIGWQIQQDPNKKGGASL